MLNSVTTTIKDVQRDLQALFPSDAILIGQAIGNDLTALEVRLIKLARKLHLINLHIIIIDLVDASIRHRYELHFQLDGYPWRQDQVVHHDGHIPQS